MGVGVSRSAEPAAARESLAEAHAALLRDRALQFELKDIKVPEPPRWLDAVGEFLRASMPVLNVLFWIVVALVVALIAWFLLRELIDARLGRKKPKKDKPAPAGWRMDEHKARILLADADRLAAEGRYAEAAHMLLLKGVEDVHDRRPREVRPALTSREIAALPQLPQRARTAFGTIAAVVERSLFGGRPVDVSAWTECRRSYEDLIVAESWR
ncbi:MAG TPA: DUF4129 domain-containing protein [Caulobacteraceae bacterium]|nr:DUF4129 domain-containing protein [Caulobacteraceae bacterium]